MAERASTAAGGSGRGGGAGRRGLAVLPGLLLLAGGVAVGMFGTSLLERPATRALTVGPVTASRLPTAEQTLRPVGFAPPLPAASSPALDSSSPPVEVAVPVIGLRSELVGLRLNRDRTLQVPTDYARAGWYSGGPAPGDPGAPALIVGHVDSTQGPAVFFRLRQLRAGDGVLVRRADGLTVRFVVYRTASYAKSRFPSRTVYAETKRRELRLITCGGEFDRASGHYSGNVVVFAAAQPVREARR